MSFHAKRIEKIENVCIIKVIININSIKVSLFLAALCNQKQLILL